MATFSQDEKRSLFSLFEGLNKKEIENRPVKSLNSDVLIVDGLNLFIRSFSVNPTMNDNGDLMGGLVGSLKSLGYAIRLNKPTRCIVVFDGDGGSARRRKIYPEYKANRKTRIRLNRMYADISTPDMESESMKKQLYMFVEYLDMLPVSIISMSNIEADDTIAYLATQVFTKPEQQVTIMSADKDFLQLVNDRVKVWSPTKKKLYGPGEIFNEYGIHPNNYALFRALDGDVSDNIDGVKGAGLKSVIKYLPIMTEEKSVTVEELIAYSENPPSKKYALHEKIAAAKDTVERNYRLMQLKEPDFAPSIQLGIQDCVSKPVQKTKMIDITRKMTEDGIHNNMPNYHIWLRETFSVLDHFAS